MSIPNYLVQDFDGTINIKTDLVPDKGFIDAIKTKNIVKFRIMSPKTKKATESYKPGGPDVVVSHITGETQVIYRKELVKNYLHASGNKIRISILKDDKQYLAYNICNEKYKIIKLPNNCVATLPNGVKTKSGYYVLARVNEAGQIDKNSITMISPNIFKKMFKIPPQEVVKRHLGRKSKSGKIFKLFNKDKQDKLNQRKREQIKPKFNSAEIGMNPSNINVASVNDKPSNTVWKPTMNRVNREIVPNKPNSSNSHYKYRVTSKVIDIEGRMLGFAVQEIATGNTRNLKVNELTQLCMNKLVENVMVVRNQRGNMYLKGNGCSLESLPQVIA